MTLGTEHMVVIIAAHWGTVGGRCHVPAVRLVTVAASVSTSSRSCEGAEHRQWCHHEVCGSRPWPCHPQDSLCGSAAGCPARLAGCRLPSTTVAAPLHRARRRLQAGQSAGLVSRGHGHLAGGGASPPSEPSSAHHALLTLRGLLHHVEHRHCLPCLPGELGRASGQGGTHARGN